MKFHTGVIHFKLGQFNFMGKYSDTEEKFLHAMRHELYESTSSLEITDTVFT